jgi:acetolactate synthase I/II/III large subunit
MPQSDAKMKLSDYVMQFVADQGLKHVFLLPGGGCLHLVDSLGNHETLVPISCLHEQSCSYAAEGYGDYTNDLGAALVTTGPGGTNAVTGAACAWVESTPCLFISGQAKRSDLIGDSGVRSMGQQELDIVSIVRPITKYAVTIMEPTTIRYHLEKAVYLARHRRRGPVWIDIPLDVQAADVEVSSLQGFEPDESNLNTEELLCKTAAHRALELLARAERPAVFVGNGVRPGTSGAELLQLVEKLQVPLLTTWRAADLVPNDHPLYSGRPGSIGQRGANFVQQNSDWLLVLGARLDLPQIAFNHANFAPGAKKIIVDVDPAELKKFQMPIELPVAANASVFIRALLEAAETCAVRDHSLWIQQCQTWQRTYPVVLPEHWEEPKDYVSTYALMDVLSDLATSEDVLVPGSSGPCSDIFMQVFRVKRGQRICNAPGLGAMGTGLPQAIGVCIASGQRRTLCINGDGGFQLNIQELETLRRLNLPLKIFVLENGGYGSIQSAQRTHFKGRLVASDPSSGLTLPDVGRIAEAYRLQTRRITDQSHLREQVKAVIELDGPVVCVVTSSPTEKVMPRATSSIQPDGTVVSKPMEDLWPPLDRDELRANMLGTESK